MNEMFSQGGKGSTGILTNKQAIARKFGVKQNEVVYFAVGVGLGGYKVIYDESTQRAYSLPSGIVSGTTAVSLSKQAVLVHSAGTVDLGELAATRREFVCLSDSFATGLVVNTRNELLVHNGIGYSYLGTLPVTITAGTNPVGDTNWKPQTDPDLREDLAAVDGRKLIGKCASIADLRTVEPTVDGQWIDVARYYTDSKPFHGSYVYDAADTTTADNGGTVIVTVGGKRWKWRFISEPTVETYGAYGDGRDDSAAFSRCIAAEDVVRFYGDLYGVLNLQPVRNNQSFEGGATTELRIITGGSAAAAAFSFVLTYREGVTYRDFAISSDTPGLGKGFYSPSSIYAANLTVENVNFKASLGFAIDANLILANVRDCWFGLEGTLGASYQHIRCTGQTPTGSNLTTNANIFENCRFFRSNSAYGIDVQNGLQCIFRNCDFEANNNTAGLIRVAGVLMAHFDKCWWERNAGAQLVKVQMDGTGTLQGCQVITFDKCWIKLDGSGNTCVLLSDTANFNVAFTHCAGTGFSGKNLFMVDATANPLQSLKTFMDNYLVGFTLIPQNTAWLYRMGVNLLEFRDTVTGAKLGGITATSTRVVIAHNTGVLIQTQAGVIIGEIVPTATGSQLRLLSQDGTTMWKLQPPTSGSTPTAAQWTPV